MNVPKLRFKEFNDDWNLIRLGDCCNLITKGTTPNRFSEYGIKFIKIESLINKKIDNNKCLYVDEKTHITTLKRSVLEEKDVLFAIAGATIGKCGIVEKENLPSNTNQALAILRTNPKKLNPYFLLNVLDSNIMKKYILLNISVGAQPNLNLEQMNNFKFKLPSEEEQLKVANFLSLLDKKIELQTKKIEDLKLFKKGLLYNEKRNNKSWNEYKISDIMNITRGTIIPKTEISKCLNNEFRYPVYSSQTSNNGILGYDNKYDFNGKFLTWTTDGANAGKVFYREGKFRCTNVCGILYNKDNRYVSELTAELLNIETPKYVSYVGNPKLMNNVMSNIIIKLPDPSRDHFFSSILKIINKKLTIEEEKFDKLFELKKGLMQNMFV